MAIAEGGARVFRTGASPRLVGDKVRHSAIGRAGCSRSAQDKSLGSSAAGRAYAVKPRKAESFRFSTDPELVGKDTGICGLYLSPPQNVIILCVDEKS